MKSQERRVQAMQMVPSELDVVRFDEPVGGWPTGTTATVLENYGWSGMVEISDEEAPDEENFNLVTVPYSKVTVIWSAALKRPVP